MLYSEYENLITSLLQKPEEAPIVAKNILDNIKSDCELISSQTETIKNADKKIRDLQDTNIKLFIGQSSKVQPAEEPVELQGDEFIENYINNLMKEEN